eukprot:TRINITY_DN14635_c0_g1_i1.p2 TRINITY_DN14635_c0_g1~~TRINITY_DN14635_c0_g1_i1.p2  ORF type:complete len:117 (-),score=41.37 TRINITY_DN14635_c0_g1_i1:265-615(-)
MSKMSDHALDLVLQKWNWAKGEERAMQKTIEKCKTEVEKAMLQRKTTMIETDKYKVSKSHRKTEHVSKNDLPAAVWSKYAKTSEFSVLSFKDKKKATKAAPMKKTSVMKTTKKKKT